MGKKILLADDSITIQKVIELTFSDEDFDVVTVGNGRLAIERVQEVRPDVVLCDIIMPEKDGYEVCDFIKKTPGLSHIPVLLLTGAFEPFDKEKADRVKADGFLAKPFEPQALISKVKDLLARNATKPPTSGVRVPTPAPAPAPTPAPAPAAAAPKPAPPAPPPPPPAPIAPPTPAFTPPPEPSITEPEEAAFIPDDAIEPEPEPAPKAAAPSPAPTPAPAVAAKPAATEDEGFGYVDDSFDPIPEEAVSLPAGKTEELSAPSSSTAAFNPPAVESWDKSTVEVSLETRAQAAIQSAKAAPAPAPVFEEVEEIEPEPEPAPEPKPVPVAVTPPPAPVAVAPPPPPPAPAPPPPVAVAPPPPAPAPPPPTPAPAPEPKAMESFADMAEPEKPVMPEKPSQAAEVPVPVDMVEKIAQRVVAQISEKVVREIAWEVIPELAEALIKQEIERLKAELQKT